MARLLASANSAVVAGLVACVLLIGLWLIASPVDRLGLASFVVRWVHVVAGIVWVGMIWFVNFIQLVAVREADEAGRTAILRLIVPRVALTFRRASHLTMASGLLLLMTTGYLFDRWVFSSTVYVPPLKSALLAFGVAAAVLMWALVHMVIWPSLRIILDEMNRDAEAKARARARVATYARLNLLLAVPVTFVMVAAAHLY